MLPGRITHLDFLCSCAPRAENILSLIGQSTVLRSVVASPNVADPPARSRVAGGPRASGPRRGPPLTIAGQLRLMDCAWCFKALARSVPVTGSSRASPACWCTAGLVVTATVDRSGRVGRTADSICGERVPWQMNCFRAILRNRQRHVSTEYGSHCGRPRGMIRTEFRRRVTRT